MIMVLLNIRIIFERNLFFYKGDMVNNVIGFHTFLSISCPIYFISIYNMQMPFFTISTCVCQHLFISCLFLLSFSSQNITKYMININAAIFPNIVQSQQYLRYRLIQLIINSIGAIGAALPKVSLLYCSIPDCYCYIIYTNCTITTILKV